MPLIMYFPDDYNLQETDSLISSLDILPTVCDSLGFSVPEWVDGVSHLKHLDDKSVTIQDNCLVEYRNGYGENDCASVALITEDYKYIRYQNGEKELTDLKRDPEERENVADNKEYKEVAREMNKKLLDELLSSQIKWPDQISHA